MTPWLTPDDNAPETKFWRVSVPDNEVHEAAFRGALQKLARVENWEEFGDATPEECADLWLEMNGYTFGMVECP